MRLCYSYFFATPRDLLLNFLIVARAERSDEKFGICLACLSSTVQYIFFGRSSNSQLSQGSHSFKQEPTTLLQHTCQLCITIRSSIVQVQLDSSQEMRRQRRVAKFQSCLTLQRRSREEMSQRIIKEGSLESYESGSGSG